MKILTRDSHTLTHVSFFLSLSLSSFSLYNTLIFTHLAPFLAVQTLTCTPHPYIYLYGIWAVNRFTTANTHLGREHTTANTYYMNENPIG